MKRLVIFASGSGSNGENIIRHFHAGNEARVVAIFTNKANAGVISRARRWNVPVVVFSKTEFSDPTYFDPVLDQFSPDLIILAGFLWLFPSRLVKKYPNRILNIHPALLPKFGGKGMYGDLVHQAVLKHGEKKHGVTVHFVNEDYDKGHIILQEEFAVEAEETLESLVRKIHTLEFQLYPRAIQMVLSGDK